MLTQVSNDKFTTDGSLVLVETKGVVKNCKINLFIHSDFGVKKDEDDYVDLENLLKYFNKNEFVMCSLSDIKSSISVVVELDKKLKSPGDIYVMLEHKSYLDYLRNKKRVTVIVDEKAVGEFKITNKVYFTISDIINLPSIVWHWMVG